MYVPLSCTRNLHFTCATFRFMCVTHLDSACACGLGKIIVDFLQTSHGFLLHSCSMRRSLDCQQKSLYRVCTGYARSGRVSSRPALFSHWRLPVSPVIVQSTLGDRVRCAVQFLEHCANFLRHQHVAGMFSGSLLSRKLFITVYIYKRVHFLWHPEKE